MTAIFVFDTAMMADIWMRLRPKLHIQKSGI